MRSSSESSAGAVREPDRGFCLLGGGLSGAQFWLLHAALIGAAGLVMVAAWRTARRIFEPT